MAIVEIDLKIEEQQSPYFEINALLSGQVYRLRFRWSYRSLAWYMRIDDTIDGIKLVNGIDLLGPYHYIDELPPGKLGIVRNSGTSSKPNFNNLGINLETTLRYEEP